MRKATTAEERRRLLEQARRVGLGALPNRRTPSFQRLSQNEVAQLARRPHRRGWPA